MWRSYFLSPLRFLRLFFCLQVLKKLSTSSSQRHFVRMKITDRTTRLLVTVLIFFLVAETPMASVILKHWIKAGLGLLDFLVGPVLVYFGFGSLGADSYVSIYGVRFYYSRFCLTQGVLGLLSALHMNTSGKQFFQVNQPFLSKLIPPKKFFKCSYRNVTILLGTWWICWYWETAPLTLWCTASCQPSSGERFWRLATGHHALQCSKMSRVPLFSKLMLGFTGINELFLYRFWWGEEEIGAQTHLGWRKYQEVQWCETQLEKITNVVIEVQETSLSDQ